MQLVVSSRSYRHRQYCCTICGDYEPCQVLLYCHIFVLPLWECEGLTKRTCTCNTCPVLQMLTFAQHPYMLLAGKALPFWIAMLSPGNSSRSEAQAPPNPAHSVLPLECVSALMDLAGAQLLQSLELKSCSVEVELPALHGGMATY